MLENKKMPPETLRPVSALDVSEIERALAGIEFPKRKRDLLEFAAARVPEDRDVLRTIQALPERIYRDAADVMSGLREIDPAQQSRSAMAIEAGDRPSPHGGDVAVDQARTLAALVEILRGIDYPCSKAELSSYARLHQDRVPEASRVLDGLARLPDLRYGGLAEVETAFRRLG